MVKFVKNLFICSFIWTEHYLRYSSPPELLDLVGLASIVHLPAILSSLLTLASGSPHSTPSVCELNCCLESTDQIVRK